MRIHVNWYSLNMTLVDSHGQYIVSIVAVGMTWWSTTKCHIQTIMINMNSCGHGMYLPVLIKFFHFSLKFYFILKTGECLGLTLKM